MQISTNDQLQKALNEDLKKMASLGLRAVVNDAVRRVFTATGTGVVLVFGHSQPDNDFWCGVKHYGSGPSSRVRIRRTPVAVVKAGPKRAAVNRRRRGAEPARGSDLKLT